MNLNNGMYQNYTVEGSVEKETKTKHEYCEHELPGIVCAPIMECPIEKCIHRQIIHEVPHVQQINTKIINHHIYKHTYSPCYTCTEENEVCNVMDSCNHKIL